MLQGSMLLEFLFYLLIVRKLYRDQCKALDGAIVKHRFSQKLPKTVALV